MIRLLISAYALSHVVQAHMEVSWPYPMKSKYNPKNLNPDYTLTAPLSPDGSEYPCKNYNTQTWPSVATLTAGGVHNITLVGSAFHNGGSCQLALSYDNGASFSVIKSFIGGCPAGAGPRQLSYTVPSYAPSGSAILAWTWVNKVGNREFYMNCASVTVVNGQSNPSTWSSLPGLWLANMRRINSCTSSEGSSPVFPRPGPEVEYGDGMSTSSPKSSSTCERVPNVQNAELPSSISSAAVSPAPTAASSIAQSGVFPLSDVVLAPESVSQSVAPSYVYSYTTCDSSYSTTQTITVTEEVISYLSASTNSAGFSTIWVSESSSCSPSTSVLSSAQSYVPLSSVSAVVPSSNSIVPPASSYQSASGVQPVISSSNVPVQSATASTPPQPTASTCLPYVQPANFNSYLPCIAGAFLCSDPSTFYTCVQGNNGNTWMNPRQVAAGMMCLPSVDPNSPGQQQQPGAPAGYYRDDLYVREGSTQPDCTPAASSAAIVASSAAVVASPSAVPVSSAAIPASSPAISPAATGTVVSGDSCSPDGSIGCYNNGQSFAICNFGTYINMGPVAPGTICVNGQIVANSAYSFPLPTSTTQSPAPPASGTAPAPAPSPTSAENDLPGTSCAPDGVLGCYNNGNSFVLCDHGAWVNMGSVAAGTTCRNGGIVAASSDTGSSPGSGGSQAPGGACAPDGVLGCFNNGQSFLMCDHGYWVNMGSVAAGTTCVNGGIVMA